MMSKLGGAMKYEKRICCFIDVLGFKSTIKESCEREEVREKLFELISEFPMEIKDSIARMVPYFPLGGENVDFERKKKVVFDGSSFRLTQFSDSFVISANIEDTIECDFLLRAIYIICLDFFFEMGLMTRGGVAVGDLIHTESGVLFGPAMNDAYELESKYAVYPRVIFSVEAKKILSEKLNGWSVIPPLGESFDGYCFVDVISVFNWDYAKKIEEMDSFGDIGEWIDRVEKDILDNARVAHPKIAYLKSRWKNRNLDS